MLLLLLIFSLTGCESEVRACHHRWAEITCKYPETNNIYQYTDVVLSNGRPVQTSKKDVWEENGRFCLYHDTKNKNLKVAIKHVKEQEFGKYRCRFFQRSNSSDIQEGKLETEHINCPRTYLSVYRTANSTFTCDYPDVYESHIKFFCKKKRFTCEDILSTPKGTFTLTGSSRALNISISHVNSQDAGDYWCGVKSNDGSYRLSHTQVHLKVIDIEPLPSTIGQNFTYQCKYNQDASSCIKFICKGEDSTVCKQLVTSTEPDVNQRFIMKENNGSITITVREVTANDSGIYWCGARVPHKHNQTHDDFFDGFNLTVGLNQGSILHPHENKNFVVVLTVCMAFLLPVLLMVVIVLILIYKRLSSSKDTGSEATAQYIKEDNIYEEIEEHFQSPGSEYATNTVYLTVDHPTNHPASLHYSTINFPISSDIAAAETLILTPSSSACKYSTVKHSTSLTTSTATHPPRPPQEPLYSKVNKLKPRQK
uniref:uncharacterized protein LOC105941082 n=2 Tax=Maylandia zebra TaxID=106582 RepID=UPI000D30CB77|nr:uncharacterized protein LOC105941082 [Maylandia zebra]